MEEMDIDSCEEYEEDSGNESCHDEGDDITDKEDDDDEINADEVYPYTVLSHKDIVDHMSTSIQNDCPKCGAIIEKNGGCNHMSCINLNSKAEFCWICKGPWNKHQNQAGMEEMDIDSCEEYEEDSGNESCHDEGDDITDKEDDDDEINADEVYPYTVLSPKDIVDHMSTSIQNIRL